MMHITVSPDAASLGLHAALETAEIMREAIVAEGNHRVDPEALTRSPKKIISVVRRQADIALIEEQKKAAEVNPTETALQAEPVNTPAPAKGLARYLPWLRRK